MMLGYERYGDGQGKREEGSAYRTFLGLMIKHHRVQMIPVAVRAAFWVRESFSAGRARSEIPAKTSAHWLRC